MSKADNRSKLMAKLGAVQLNTVWSWCAVNEQEKKVYFSIWTDKKCEHNGKRSYILQSPDWGVDEQGGKKSAARNDHDAKFDLVFNHQYMPYGYFQVAKDPASIPREIAETRTSFVMSLQLDKLDDGSIIGTPLVRTEIR